MRYSQLECLPGQWIPWQRCIAAFHSPSSQVPALFHKLGHDRKVSHPNQLLTVTSFYSDFLHLFVLGVESKCCTWSHQMVPLGEGSARPNPPKWKYTTLKIDTHPCPRRDSEQKFWVGERQQNARPPGSALWCTDVVSNELTLLIPVNANIVPLTNSIMPPVLS
jgi:hypothetical protein